MVLSLKGISFLLMAELWYRYLVASKSKKLFEKLIYEETKRNIEVLVIEVDLRRLNFFISGLLADAHS